MPTTHIKWKTHFLSACKRQYSYERKEDTYSNFPLVLSILASCILLLVTSNGYETHWASAPDKPPQSSLAGMVRTAPPNQKCI